MTDTPTPQQEPLLPWPRILPIRQDGRPTSASSSIPASVDATEYMEGWLRSNSSLLVLSGPPGSGKYSLLRRLKELAGSKSTEIETEPDFPPLPPKGERPTADAVLRDLIRPALDDHKRIAVATEIRFDAASPYIGAIDYLTPLNLHPWVGLIEPTTIRALQDHAKDENWNELRIVADFLEGLESRTGQETWLLRTFGALHVLLEVLPGSSADTSGNLAEIVEGYVRQRLFRMSPAARVVERQQEYLLGELCFQHFMGRLPPIGPDEPSPERSDGTLTTLEAIARIIQATPGFPDSVSTEEFVSECPFLAPSDSHLQEPNGPAHLVTLPDRLTYEYFVAVGFLQSLRRRDESLADGRPLMDMLVDGLVMLFIQSNISQADHEQLVADCLAGDLENEWRLVHLYLLEDHGKLVELLIRSSDDYKAWLRQITDPTDTETQLVEPFIWKMAAYQRILLGDDLVDRYLARLQAEDEPEMEGEKALEFHLQGALRPKNIVTLLLRRLEADHLQRVRPITAYRLGDFGDSQCVVPLVVAALSAPRDKYTEVYVQAISRLVSKRLR